MIAGRSTGWRNAPKWYWAITSSRSTEAAIQAQRDTIQRIFDDLKAGQADLARFLPDILDMMDTALTLNERYDLLNVNPVHRQWTDADAPHAWR